ncbi:MAG: MFS transporter [Burkholderiales bacterium]|nr:MFS transporter [Burkholderiales bacterium]MDE1928834.1 MFS transporter [Burkholderiales bacterium]MDE2504425.1 MFS transporter [Burkholderiales bacterium]
MVSIGLIIPVLPHIVGLFTHGKTEQTWWSGAVFLAFSSANFLASPVLGALSDRYGRRPVLLIGFSGLALSTIVTGLATHLWMLIAVRLVSGAMQANVSVAQAYVADITPPAERARRFGLLGAMFGIGFILGPVLGGILGAVNIRLPFFVAGGLSCVNWLYGWFILPESLPPERRRPFEWRRAHPLAALRGLSELQGVGLLVATVGLLSLAQFTMHTSWVLYTDFKFGWGPGQVGWSLFTVGLVSAFSQGVLLKHLLARVSAPRLALFSIASSMLTFLCIGLATQGWMLYAIIVVGNIAGAGGAATIQSLISNAADAQNQGQTMGSVGSLNSLAAVTAPLFATPLLGAVSKLDPASWKMGLPFFFCAALAALSLSFALVHFRRPPATAAAAA